MSSPDPDPGLTGERPVDTSAKTVKQTSEEGATRMATPGDSKDILTAPTNKAVRSVLSELAALSVNYGLLARVDGIRAELGETRSRETLELLERGAAEAYERALRILDPAGYAALQELVAEETIADQRQGALATGQQPATPGAAEQPATTPVIGVDSRLTATEARVRDAGERPAPVSNYDRASNRVDFGGLRCRCICKPGIERRNLECVCHGDPDPDYGLHDKQEFGRTP